MHCPGNCTKATNPHLLTWYSTACFHPFENSYVLVNHIGTSRLAQLHQNMHIIRLGLDFDYNHRTFIPTKPKIVSPDTLGEKLANEMKDTYHMLLHKQAPVNALRFVALLQVNGIDGLTAAMPMIQEPSDTNLTKATWEEQCRLFHDIHLQSSKLTSWANIQQENVKLQIQNGIASNSAFQPFLVSALWIESNSSRHKTHIVVIKMEMGFGLGEIKHLDSFQVDPVADTILKMESNSNIPRAQVDYYKQHMFDLEHAPALLSSRVTHPNNALLPVVFWCPGYVFVLPNLIEIMPDHFVFATKKCDKKAREAFAKLQRVQLPRIKSPALH